MKRRRPLTDEEGEVRELLLEDIRQFRPMTEGISPSLAAKLGLEVEPPSPAAKKRRKSGIPTGNAGEYLVMGELLRRGFDAQLADRNTKGYDLVVASRSDAPLRRVQVKTVRIQPWYVRRRDFEGELLQQVTVYVLLGSEDSSKPPRFFIAKNCDLAEQIHVPTGWSETGFVGIKTIEKFENRWNDVAA